MSSSSESRPILQEEPLSTPYFYLINISGALTSSAIKGQSPTYNYLSSHSLH